MSVLPLFLNVYAWLKCILTPQGLGGPKLSMFKISNTPELKNPISFDIDKLQLLPGPSCYPLCA
jgi:hypothetical protein